MSKKTRSHENFNQMIEEMGRMLQVVNSSLMDPKDYDFEKFDEIEELHALLKHKGKLTVAETNAFIEELKNYRK
ncbi:Uncharacterized protein YfkK, UPF0435 family [Gracilibacillus ureilyticus]|uniref:Uncharacterized protein YfkK, UPF0435 family n=1 Tax=Gracilibacillus ureilyticus TaxID=531814 RepID=A0A1H9L384_9BACI|nr:DUF1128 family protein [Gracilibacillus ureilyticus]SER05615.1 Uncharacterized protein YfkK, UPF0435 family [Gracilibacillus ureilyticus]